MTVRPARSPTWRDSAVSAAVSRARPGPGGRSPRTSARSCSRLPRTISRAARASRCTPGSAVPGEAVERQQQRGELLADLVVQLSGDPSALVFLGDQQPCAAGTPLAFQAVGHRVEARGERAEFGIVVLPPAAVRASSGSTLAIPEISRLSGANVAPHQREVDDQQRADTGDERRRFLQRDRAADGRRCQRQRAAGDDQHDRVDREHLPKQRQPRPRAHPAIIAGARRARGRRPSRCGLTPIARCASCPHDDVVHRDRTGMELTVAPRFVSGAALVVIGWLAAPGRFPAYALSRVNAGVGGALVGVSCSSCSAARCTVMPRSRRSSQQRPVVRGACA